jgi:ActR/RegA family two-component response regulator
VASGIEKLGMFGRVPSLLFVDDEEIVRTTLGMTLESKGFKVTVAAAVPEALRLISNQAFDVLIADLNIGHPGDGFTVVSAMRRTQPNSATFILTGYPAFETALEAIRQQVDDYLLKPTEIDTLVEKIRTALAKTPRARIAPKRLAEIIQQNRDSIIQKWLEQVKKDPEIAAIRMSNSDRTDHLPRLLDESLNRAQGGELSTDNARAAVQHGITRRKQGYTIPLLIREAKILQVEIGNCVQEKLLEVQVSHLMSDLVRIDETIQTELEASLKAFLKDSTHPRKAKPLVRKARSKRSK